MFKLSSVWADLMKTRQFIIVATIIFSVSMYFGATNDGFAAFLDTQIEGIKQLAGKIDNSANPTLTMIKIIFLNNAIKAVVVIFTGALFGLLPVFFLVINGMIIGYILQQTAMSESGITVFELIFKGLLPHGILEIPAILIASAYGLRLGKALFSIFGALLFDQNKLNFIGSGYVLLLKRCGVISIYLVIILLLAAIIEGTITPWLLQM